MNDAPEFFRTREAAQFLALSPRTLEALRRTGEGPAFSCPTRRSVIYARADLVAWAARGRRRSTSDPGADLTVPDRTSAKRQLRTGRSARA